MREAMDYSTAHPMDDGPQEREALEQESQVEETEEEAA